MYIEEICILNVLSNAGNEKNNKYHIHFVLSALVILFYFLFFPLNCHISRLFKLLNEEKKNDVYINVFMIMIQSVRSAYSQEVYGF